mmetsp:Transcript_34080/g.54543  ORF Transcript_34080/g.54543 Transcript_34080/m.54543 type:complete len:116 (-) Transcript_34080:642-989(-)
MIPSVTDDVLPSSSSSTRSIANANMPAPIIFSIDSTSKCGWVTNFDVINLGPSSHRLKGMSVSADAGDIKYMVRIAFRLHLICFMSTWVSAHLKPPTKDVPSTSKNPIPLNVVSP